MRWIALIVGLGLALGTGYALLGVRVPSSTTPGRMAKESPAGERRLPVAAPRDHIDDDSREALRDILREADEEGAGS